MSAVRLKQVGPRIEGELKDQPLRFAAAASCRIIGWVGQPS